MNHFSGRVFRTLWRKLLSHVNLYHEGLQQEHSQRERLRRGASSVTGGVAAALVALSHAVAAETLPSLRAESVSDAISSIAAKTPGQQPGDVALVTRNRNLEELGQELSRIYLTLYNSKRLSVRPIKATEHSIEAALRSNGLFYGKSFPLELDSLLCDLNSNVCRRNRVSAATEQLQSLTSNVSGYLPSTTQWSLDGAVETWVPDVSLAEDREWLPYDLQAGQSLASIVVDELGGCKRYDDGCQKLINFYNPSLGSRSKNLPVGARLVLPVLTIKVSANVADANEANKAISADTHTVTSSKLELQKIDSLRTNDSYKVIYNGGVPVNVPPDLPKPPTPPVPIPDQVLKQLQHNIVPKINLKVFDTPPTSVLPGQVVLPADVRANWQELGGLIAWPPYLQQLPYPPQFRGAVPVGVLDSRVDDQHCAFDSAHLSVTNSSGAPALVPAHCDLAVPGREDIDHGTHVVGIIGSFFPQGASRLPIGLNPYAQVASLEIDVVDPSTDKIATDMKNMVQERLLKVVNMSFGYIMTAQNPDLQLRDPLEEPIAALSNATLFVAAAGNAGIDKSYLCDIRPACFDLPNVISVAALDRNASKPAFVGGDQRLRSNYGNRVHVAAIGQDVFSALVGGRFGRLTGTSQAAPQVTALASLLFSKYPNDLRPIEAKNRIIYCSDMMQSLEDKVFSGGRINADCALDGDVARLRLKVENTPQKGKFDFLTQTLQMLDQDERELDYPVRNIRSLQHNAWDDSYTIFYNSQSNRDSTLLRVSRLKFRNPGAIVKFTPAGGVAGTSTLNNIAQYVSSLK